ncbi:MAG TPA: serine hydrolase [Chitinophagaceae bacterium]|nr:serine hydrolase [Chitinophagaceae bacterium]
MSKKMVFLLLACCCLAGAFSQAQSKLTQQQFTAELDNFTQKILERVPVIPAITITIVSENGAVFNKAYGWANKETGLKADINTAFYIASSTKSFTALAAALLDNEKKILLDDPVKKYLSFSSDIGDDVTIRSLLTHTSGLENNPLVFRMAFSGMTEEKEMMKVLTNGTTARARPGAYKYDNLGYNIYALALQERLHVKWQDLLQDKIFTPLGMKRTTACVSHAKKNNWPVAMPYNAYGVNGLERVYLEKNDNTMQSAGGLITTPSDIAMWLQAQINNGKIKNKQVFPEQVMKAVHTGVAPYERGTGIFAAPGKYGLGWLVSQYRNENIVFHFGGFPGFRTHISFMPGKKTGLAIFVNESTVGSVAADMLAGYIYDWITGQENITDTYNKKLDELEANHKRAIDGSQRSYADRAKRTWQLSLPLETYAGKFRHEFFGDMDVTVDNNVLAVKMGNLYAVSTPFTQKESIRVELIPGTGQVVYFKLDESGKVNSLSYDGQQYKRVF